MKLKQNLRVTSQDHREHVVSELADTRYVEAFYVAAFMQDRHLQR